MNVPILMITWNRLEYTKRALAALVKSNHSRIIIIDNGSTDGTVDYLKSANRTFGIEVIFNTLNIGIAGAMNQFLGLTKQYEFVGKVDNDTIVPSDWIGQLLFYMGHCDIIQAKHHIIKETDPGGWDSFVSKMPKIIPGLYRNHFVGGSGIIFKRQLVDKVPEVDWMLGGWREFQRQKPDLVKAFCSNVEIKLLDEHGYTDYPDYYITTKRLKA